LAWSTKATASGATMLVVLPSGQPPSCLPLSQESQDGRNAGKGLLTSQSALLDVEELDGKALLPYTKPLLEADS
jgi:hypothetical protein